MFASIINRDDRSLSSLLALAKKESLEQTDPKTGLSMLATAVSCDNIDAIRLLVDAGANPNGQSSAGQQSALHVAASKGLVSCVDLLIEFGANVNAQDTLLMTPLHSASQSGNASAVATLLARGADVKATAKHGWTALHRAASKGYTDIVQLLCEHGADVMAMLDSSTSKKLASCTAKMLAEQAHHIDTAAYLSSQMRKAAPPPNPIESMANASMSLNSTLFGKIAALKTNSGPVPNKSELRRLAADGHARAKSVAVAKEDVPKRDEPKEIAVDKDVVAGSLTPIPVRPALQKRGHKQNLLAEAIPEVAEILKPTPIPWSQPPTEPSPSPSSSELSGRSTSPPVRSSPASVVDNSLRQEVDELQTLLSKVQSLVASQQSRIRMLELTSVFLALLVILSLVLR